MDRPIQIRFKDIKRLAPGSGLLRYAHHPHCDRHIHHLIWIKGRPFCLGCTSIFAGVPVGIIVATLVDWSEIPFFLWIIFHGLGVVPTAFQPLIQRKWYKIFARVALGATSASYFYSGLIIQAYFQNEWLWRGCVVFAFASCFFCLYKWRQVRIDDPCYQCPLGTFPTCEWNMPRLLSANVSDPAWKAVADDQLKKPLNLSR